MSSMLSAREARVSGLVAVQQGEQRASGATSPLLQTRVLAHEFHRRSRSDERW